MIAFDATRVGALYRIRLVQARAHRRMLRETPGTTRARECHSLVMRLVALERDARRAADKRFDPAGL